MDDIQTLIESEHQLGVLCTVFAVLMITVIAVLAFVVKRLHEMEIEINYIKYGNDKRTNTGPNRRANQMADGQQAADPADHSLRG